MCCGQEGSLKPNKLQGIDSFWKSHINGNDCLFATPWLHDSCTPRLLVPRTRTPRLLFGVLLENDILHFPKLWPRGRRSSPFHSRPWRTGHGSVFGRASTGESVLRPLTPSCAGFVAGGPARLLTSAFLTRKSEVSSSAPRNF